MTTIRATVHAGRLNLDVPPEWAEGTQVEISPMLSEGPRQEETISPEEIAEILAVMDRMEPLDWSAEDRDSWEADRLARREREKAQFAGRAANLGSSWE